MIDHFALFTLSSIHHGPGFQGSDLKALANRLQKSFEARGFDVGEVFGSSTDLWMFSIDCDGFEISVGISPDYGTSDDRWCTQNQLVDPGWFTKARTERLTKLTQIDWATHDALIRDIGARDIEWHIGKGRIRRGEGQPTPEAT
jgi:hypothetical protein